MIFLYDSKKKVKLNWDILNRLRRPGTYKSSDETEIKFGSYDAELKNYLRQIRRLEKEGAHHDLLEAYNLVGDLYLKKAAFKAPSVFEKKFLLKKAKQYYTKAKNVWIGKNTRVQEIKGNLDDTIKKIDATLQGNINPSRTILAPGKYGKEGKTYKKMVTVDPRTKLIEAQRISNKLGAGGQAARKKTLEKEVVGFEVLAISFLLISLVLASVSVTGYSILNLSSENSGFFGCVSFIVGLIFAFLYSKMKLRK